MIKDSDKEVALERILGLQPDDGAFVRRTDGKWTYSIVKKMDSDFIQFIVNPNGSTKDYKQKYWVSHVRVLNKDKSSSSSGDKKEKDKERSSKKEKKEKKEKKSSSKSSRFNTTNVR